MLRQTCIAAMQNLSGLYNAGWIECVPKGLHDDIVRISVRMGGIERRAPPEGRKHDTGTTHRKSHRRIRRTSRTFAGIGRRIHLCKEQGGLSQTAHRKPWDKWLCQSAMTRMQELATEIDQIRGEKRWRIQFVFRCADNFCGGTELQRGYLFGQDEISDRPNQTETYHDVWFTDRQCAKANGVWHVFVFRAYAVNGDFDAYRCEYVGRWESVKTPLPHARFCCS